MLCAKNAVYWPGMYKEIQILVGTCRAYKKFENAQVKCPMVEMEIPSQPWYSKVPFVPPLPNSGAYTTVRAFKSIFSENGIPAKLISDNGTYSMAGEFKRFAVEWEFEMVLSSPE